MTFCHHSDMDYVHSLSPLSHTTLCGGNEGEENEMSSPVYCQTSFVSMTKNDCVYSLGNYAMN